VHKLNKSKILGRLMIISGILLLISGIVFIVLGVLSSPNMSMSIEEFGAAMDLSSGYFLTGILMLGGGGFLLLPGFLIQFVSSLSEKKKVSSIGTSNIYARTSQTLKKSDSKESSTCPYCQNEVQIGLNICPECGSKL
jgi:hypothetical protein